MKTILALLFLAACSSVKFDPFIKPEPKQAHQIVGIQESWIGKEVEVLDTHPFYAARFVNSRVSSKGVEVRTYRNSGGSASQARCTGILGCSGETKAIQCDHIFYISSGKITDRKRIGDCGEEDENFRAI
ncbi:MAG: hypothetical protein V4598_16450 [Bdellovibrionota bacterium]